MRYISPKGPGRSQLSPESILLHGGDDKYEARQYQRLKMLLAAEYSNDRVAYTNGKTDFIVRVMKMAKAARIKPNNRRKERLIDAGLLSVWSPANR
jgi:hypothetical protein